MWDYIILIMTIIVWIIAIICVFACQHIMQDIGTTIFYAVYALVICIAITSLVILDRYEKQECQRTEETQYHCGSDC